MYSRQYTYLQVYYYVQNIYMFIPYNLIHHYRIKIWRKMFRNPNYY